MASAALSSLMRALMPSLQVTKLLKWKKALVLRQRVQGSRTWVRSLVLVCWLHHGNWMQGQQGLCLLVSPRTLSTRTRSTGGIHTVLGKCQVPGKC